jgi:hypothetical protein
MNIENVNVTIDGQAPVKPVEIIIREGAAAAAPVTIQQTSGRFEGSIETAANMIQTKSHLVNDDSVIKVDADINSPSIEIDFHPNQSIGVSAIGRILPYPELANFQFNANKCHFDNKSFIKVLRQHAHCFPDMAELKALIKSLSQFQATMTVEMKDLDDRKGNTDVGVMTSVNKEKSGIPEAINFCMPFIQNGEKQLFTAEVEVEVDGRDIKFGLYSLELQQAKIDYTKAILDQELQSLPPDLTVIYLN